MKNVPGRTAQAARAARAEVERTGVAEMKAMF